MEGDSPGRGTPPRTARPSHPGTFQGSFHPAPPPPSQCRALPPPPPPRLQGGAGAAATAGAFSGVKVSSYVQLPARAAFPTPVEIGKAVEKLWKMAAPAADCRHLPPSNAAASSRRRAAQPTHLRVRRPLPERWLPGRTCRPTLPQTPE